MLAGNRDDRKSQRRLKAQSHDVCETHSSLQAPRRGAVLVTGIAVVIITVIVISITVSQTSVPRTILNSGPCLNPNST